MSISSLVVQLEERKNELERKLGNANYLIGELVKRIKWKSVGIPPKKGGMYLCEFPDGEGGFTYGEAKYKANWKDWFLTFDGGEDVVEITRWASRAR